MPKTILLIAIEDHSTGTAGQNVLELAPDQDPRTLQLDGIDRIDLKFPKFTDGRAFSQAYLLRRRLGFEGELRATGDVLVDQLIQMQRAGFSPAVLRADQNIDHARRQLQHFSDFYQGDAPSPKPWFARTTTVEPETPTGVTA